MKLDDEKYPDDKGCVLHPSCKTCPFPRCIKHEFPGGIAGYIRYIQMCELLASGLDVYSTAIELHVSEKIIRRYRKVVI